MKLNEEIQQLLRSFSLPAEASRKIGDAMARLDANRIAPGLEIGEKAANFELPDMAGREVSLEERLNQGPVVLTFYRGAWCPVCNLQLLALQRALPDIRLLGASLIAVSPDNSMPTPGDTQLEFDMLHDGNQSVIREYNLQYRVPQELHQIYIGVFDADVSSYNPDGSWNLPVPGTFVIDRAGTIRNRHVTADFLKRMEPQDIIAALKDLN